MAVVQFPQATDNFLAGGGEMGSLIRGHDWAATSLGSPDSWPQALRTALRMILSTQHPMFVFWGSDLLCFYNDAYRASIGPERHPSALGRPGREVWEEIWDIIGPQVEQVMAGLGATWHENHLVPITRHGKREDVYWTYSYGPIDDVGAPNGVGGVLVVCAETTDSVLAARRQKVEHDQLAQMFEQAPGFMAMLRGPEHRIELVNPAYLKLVGHRDVIGKTVAEALPEAVGQGYLDLLDRVYRSGEAFSSTNAKYAVQVTPNGPVNERFLDFVYQPITDLEGRVVGIFVEGSDITERREAEVRLALSEEQLRLATEAAEVGLWDVDLITDTLFWPARVKAMFGISPDVPVSMADFYNGLHLEDCNRTSAAFAAAANPEIRSLYDVEYRTIGKEDGVVRWVAAKGRGLFDESGVCTRVIGTAIDITARKASEARREALAQLSVQVRDLDDPADIVFAAAEALGRTMNVSRVGYATIDDDAETLHVNRDWIAPGVASLAGVVQLREYGSFIDSLKRNQVVAISDVREDHRTAIAATALEDRSARSFVNVPVIERSRLVAVLFVNHFGVRDWPQEEIGFLREVAERTRTAVERCRNEAGLRESEARFRNMADHAPAMMWVTDPHGSCTYLNRAWYEFTGQNAGEAESLGWLDATHPEDRAEAERTFLAANAARASLRIEYRLRRADGVYRWAIDAASPRFSSDGEFLGYIGSVIDIDERHEMESALRVSEMRYRTLFEAIDAGFCVVEVMFNAAEQAVDYRFVEVNPAFERQTGLKEAVGRTARELVPNLELHWLDIYGRVALTGDAARFENGSDAMARWFDVYALRIGDPAARRVAILFNDISERRAAEKALRELNERLEARVVEALAERRLFAEIVESTDAFIQVVNLDYRWLAINKASADEFERIFGIRPKVGDNMLDLLNDRPEHQAAVKTVWARALGGEAYTEIGEFGDPALDRRTYEMKFNNLRGRDGSVVGAYQFVYDVTDRLRAQARLAEAERQLLQAQKIEAIGQLTGGVAHDFNNLLMVISGGLSLLDKPGDALRRQRILNGMRQAAERGASLSRQLLAFSRRQPLTPEPVDLVRQIKGMSELLDRTLRGDVHVNTGFAADLWPVTVDPAELELVVLNLCVNARDAMPQGGTISISAENAPARQRDRLTCDFVRLTVTDTGTGMAPEVVARAFEPFFTTKEIGKGSGLGLAQVHGFVTQSGGEVEVSSTVGHGTTITLWLPRSDQLPAASERHLIQLDVPRTPARVAGAALLVEDDDQVAKLVSEMLRELGYEVTRAINAEAALCIMANSPAIDIVLSDIMMPGQMNGVDLAREIRRRQPELPIVLTSGYSDVARRGTELDGIELLAKPYLLEDLAAVLRRVHVTNG